MRQLAVFINIACENELEVLIRCISLQKTFAYSARPCEQIQKRDSFFPSRKDFFSAIVDSLYEVV